MSRQIVTFVTITFISIAHAFWEALKRMIGQLLSFITGGPDPRAALLDKLTTAESYSDWQDAAEALDALTGNDLWRQTPMSNDFDYKLIASRFRLLISARKEDKRIQLAELVRAGSLRNLGGICVPNLYNRAYGGTKYLIEDYISEVIQSLEFLAERPDDAPKESASERQRRLDFFHDTRQSFGRTALVLHGGSLFGLCHVGAVKALLVAGLLPSVITGATVGAIVAALVCSVAPGELESVLNGIPEAIPAFDAEYEGSYSVVEGVIRSLYPPEILLFERYVTARLGTMTFEEAYMISGKVLNITVLPVVEEPYHREKPTRLLNYLVTPNVVIASAVRASIGTNVLPRSTPVEILAKDYKGRVIPLYPKPYEFRPANSATYLNARDSPYNRLSELFNVNNFVVSITRPYFAPLLLSDFQHRGERRWSQRAIRLARTSIQYRMAQLSELGLMPRIMQTIFVDEKVPGGFQVNIVPEDTSLLHNCALILDSHNIKGKVAHWIRIGERSVWPMSAIIWARTAIEYALDGIYEDMVSQSR